MRLHITTTRMNILGITSRYNTGAASHLDELTQIIPEVIDINVAKWLLTPTGPTILSHKHLIAPVLRTKGAMPVAVMRATVET